MRSVQLRSTIDYESEVLYMAILSAIEYDTKVSDLRSVYRHRIEVVIAQKFGWAMVSPLMAKFDHLTVRQMMCNSVIDMTGAFKVLS